MTLNKAQQEVDEWINLHKIGYWKPHEIMVRLMEETGELAREINHEFGPKQKKKTEKNNEISDELGDVLFTIISLANSLNINLDESFSKVMKKCYGRDKDRFEKK